MNIEYDKRGVFLIAAAIAAVAGVALGVSLQVRYANVHSQRLSLDAEIRTAQARASQLDSVAAELEQLRQEPTAAHGPAPDSLDSGTILSQLSIYTDTHDVAIERIQTREMSKVGDFTGVQVLLDVQDTYPQVFGLVRFIEMHDWLMRIDRLSLNREAGSRDPWVNGSVEFTTFVPGDTVLE